MHIKVSFLLGPGSGQNTSNKFYIGIEDDRCPAVIYGANTASASGSTKRHATAKNVSDMIRKKSRGEYWAVDPSEINRAAQQSVINHICQHIPGAEPKRASFQRDGVIFGAGASNPGSAGIAKADRPKRFKKVHAWI